MKYPIILLILFSFVVIALGDNPGADITLQYTCKNSVEVKRKELVWGRPYFVPIELGKGLHAYSTLANVKFMQKGDGC